MYYVILTKSKVEKWSKKWPADPKIQNRPGTKEIDKLIEQTIEAGDKNEEVKRSSLRFTDKGNKKKTKPQGPQEGGSEPGEESEGGEE